MGDPLSTLSRWASAKDEERRLLKVRDSLRCDYGDFDTDPGDTDNVDHVPCWKCVTIEVEGYYGPKSETGPNGGDFEDWCPSCQARQRAHDALMVARRRRAGLEGALWRAGREVARG